MSELTPDMAASFARLTLGHVTKQYPHKLDHVMASDADALSPRVLHPVFYGSFDWHSCVHGWWQLFRIATLYPDLPEAAAIREKAAALFTPEAIEAEHAYVLRPESAGFERPYGWGWFLALHKVAAAFDPVLRSALAPMAATIAARFTNYLARMTYPIRAGVHSNTAFAAVLALDWDGDAALSAAIHAKAQGWFGEDRDAQAWEPDSDAFLSPTLIEALLMRRVLVDKFAGWFAAFLPRLALRQPATLFTPATVSDRSDGKIAHLDGLNLSRAWCWRGIAEELPSDSAAIANAVADAHIAASLPHIAGDYAGEHWLASFALLALEGL
jgi:Protein of unknown function (DUF2891)